MKKKKDIYVNNKKFVGLLEKYQQDPSRVVYEKLGRIFLEISTRYLYKPNVVNYTKDIKDDTISDATFMMVKAINKFDSSKSQNAFAYFTQIVHNSFLQNLSKFKRRDAIFTSLDFIDNIDEIPDFITIRESIEKVDVSEVNSKISKYF